MGEVASFCTEFVWCAKCLDVAEQTFHELRERCEVIRHPKGDTVGFIAGSMKASGGAGDDIIAFEHFIAPIVAKVICHDLRVAVLAEAKDCYGLFKLKPGGVVKDLV